MHLKRKKNGIQINFFRGNYTLPTCDLSEKDFTYLWFKNWHFTCLRLALFVSHYPPLLKTGVNLYFFYPFMSLPSLNIKKLKKSREKKI